ncbi:MAG: peptidyl-prolyl cis-trans isomerase [bacterium]
MFEWMNRHKKDIMTYTLWLVIPSFIVLYGYGECQKPAMIQWAATVNGDQITDQQLAALRENLQRQYQQFGQDLDFDQLHAQAMRRAIVSVLNEQKARELGLHTTDSEVSRSIREMEYFKDEAGNFSAARYRNVLLSNNIHPIQFEEEQRDNLTRMKIQSFVSSTLFPSAGELQRIKSQEEQKIQVEYLAFEPSRYTQDVQVDEGKLKEFFEGRKKQYEIPEQRRVDYAVFLPSSFVNGVTFSETQLTRFFQENQENYRIPDRVRVDHIAYTAKQFADRAQVTEEEIQKYYNDNLASYQHQEKIRVRYVMQPLAPMAGQEAVTDEAIQQYYETNLARFQHPEDLAKASHILLKVTPEATAEESEAVKKRILDIRQEIADGKITFADAAKKYSQDSSAVQGGELGYFPRGRMTAAFEKAAFELPLGQISEPVKTEYGYHLILVEDRKQKGTDPLEAVKNVIRDTIQKQNAFQAFQAKTAPVKSLDELAGQYEIKTTDWFARGEDIAGIPTRDRLIFSSAAFQTNAEKPVQIAGREFSENLYVIEFLERQPATPMTLEEARSRVVLQLKQTKAASLVKEFAQADLDRIKKESLKLEDIAKERGLEIQTSGLFGREDSYVPGFGPRPTELISTAFTLNVGETGGPIQMQDGVHIIRLTAREPEHLPELAEVRDRAVKEYVQSRAESLARVEANNFAYFVIDNALSLPEAAAKQNIAWGTTPLFKMSDPIEGIGPQPAFNYAAFDLQKVGEVSLPVPVSPQSNPANPSAKQPVQAYYIMKLNEIKEPYIPDLAEVREKAEEDYRLFMAGDLAIQSAEQTLKMIQDALVNAQPVSATQAVALKQYDDLDSKRPTGKGALYRGPSEITGNGFVPGIAGRALPFTKTVLALEPGKISGVVKIYQERMDENKHWVRDRLAGAYIVQVLGKSAAQEKPDAEIPSLQQLEQRLKAVAFQAWIEEVSAAATIKYHVDSATEEDGTTNEKLSQTKQGR